jgi:pimeloyl-ACP methyl ester carboxylesterase
LHSDPEITAGKSLEDLRILDIPQGAVVIGISLGGMLAAKLQETARRDLHVVCISSPIWADEVRLTRRMTNRLALYSSKDGIIKGRTKQWPRLAQAYDLPWLTHDTDAHKGPLSKIVGAFLHGNDPLAEIIASENELRQMGEID